MTVSHPLVATGPRRGAMHGSLGRVLGSSRAPTLAAAHWSRGLRAQGGWSLGVTGEVVEPAPPQ